MEDKRLYRSRKDSVIGGVCGGLGKHLNIDPILVRVLFILAVVLAGGGVLVYLVLWIVVPLEPINLFQNAHSANAKKAEEHRNDDHQSSGELSSTSPTKTDGSLWGGLILISLGILFLASRFIPRINFGDLWPVILIVIGVILITKSKPSNKNQ